MDDPRFAIWNVLHDGKLEALTREDPNILVIRISIPYLRGRMTPPGEPFCLRLGGCRDAAFSPREPSDSSSSLEDIARRKCKQKHNGNYPNHRTHRMSSRAARPHESAAWCE